MRYSLQGLSRWAGAMATAATVAVAVAPVKVRAQAPAPEPASEHQAETSRFPSSELSFTNPVAPAASDPFARYLTPGQCRQAAGRLYGRYWRDKRPDTVVYAPQTDSVPLPVVRAIRPCVERFSSATLAPDELHNLAALYLWLGNDSLAQQTIDRAVRLQASRSASERGWVLSLWVEALLAARPMRTALARRYLAQLDALGAPAATWRVFAHTSFAERALTINDRVTSDAEARAALAASRQMSGDDRIDWYTSIQNAYVIGANVAALMHGGPAALSLLDTMKTDMSPLRPVGSPDQRDLLRGFQDIRTPFTFLGRSAMPRVHADAWYGAPGDTIHPRPGALTIVTFFYGPSYPTFATMRRLHDKYGARGLEIVMMTTTRGYFRGMPMPSPKVEADSLGSYAMRYLKLPASLAAEVTRFSHIADGRRRDEETPNQDSYSHAGGVMLIDRTGVVRWVGGFDPRNEAVWDAVIQSAL